jgi:hypothetical protein
MTSTIAVVVAIAATALSLVLLVVVVRQGRSLRNGAARIDDLDAEQRRSADRLEQMRSQQEDTLRALELALSAGPGTSTVSSSSTPENDEDVTVITDISSLLPADRDPLTTGRIASVTLGGPLLKVAAFSHGVRRALDEEQRMRISYAVRKELKRQRKMRRRRRAEGAPSKGWGT